MAKDRVGQESRDNLIEALGSGHLSEALQAQGQDLLNRMDKVLRLSVMGLPKSGKTSLLNLLLGTPVLPTGVSLPTLSMVYGDAELARCTLPDGEVREIPGVDMEAIAALSPVYVELEMPLPALRKLSMMEVVAGAEVAEQMRSVKWASKRTDIVLWCTQQSSELEDSLWGQLPDHLLDHAFLVLTKADIMALDGTLEANQERAQSFGGEVFFKILSVQTETALNARQTDGSVDREALRASGAMTLISSILREVETGQRAAADAADVFLRQIDFVPDQNDLDGALEVAQEQVVSGETATITPTGTPGQSGETAAKSGAGAAGKAPEIAPAEQPVEAETVTVLSDEARRIFAIAVDQLSAEGAALAERLDQDDVQQDDVVDVSVDTVIWLADYLSESDLTDDSVAQRTCAMAKDAADLVQLIQLETGDTVAMDALSVMIQLKQEIQAELAA